MVTLKINKLTEQVEVITELPDFVLTFESIRSIYERIKDTSVTPDQLLVINLGTYVPE